MDISEPEEEIDIQDAIDELKTLDKERTKLKSQVWQDLKELKFKVEKMSKSKSGYRRVKWLFGKEIEVPDEWIKTNLNAVCRSVRDGTHTPPRRISSGIPLLSAQNIMNNGINWKEHFSYISKYDFEQITKNNKNFNK